MAKRHTHALLAVVAEGLLGTDTKNVELDSADYILNEIEPELAVGLQLAVTDGVETASHLSFHSDHLFSPIWYTVLTLDFLLQLLLWLLPSHEL